MSETPEAATEQPTTDTPDGTGTEQTQTTEPEVNWQERYTNLQPEYTRASQEAAELRRWREQIENDPEAQREFLKTLGYDLEDDTLDAAAFDDPRDAQIARLEQRIAAHEQKFQSTEAQQQIAAAEAHFERAFQKIGSERGYPLTEEEQDAIYGMALTMPADPSGFPPAEDAYKRLNSVWDHRQQHWAQTKEPAHQVSRSGGPVTEDNRLDVDDPDERVRRMAQRFADLSAAD